MQPTQPVQQGNIPLDKYLTKRDEFQHHLKKELVNPIVRKLLSHSLQTASEKTTFSKIKIDMPASTEAYSKKFFKAINESLANGQSTQNIQKELRELSAVLSSSSVPSLPIKPKLRQLLSCPTIMKAENGVNANILSYIKDYKSEELEEIVQKTFENFPKDITQSFLQSVNCEDLGHFVFELLNEYPITRKETSSENFQHLLQSLKSNPSSLKGQAIHINDEKESYGGIVRRCEYTDKGWSLHLHNGSEAILKEGEEFKIRTSKRYDLWKEISQENLKTFTLKIERAEGENGGIRDGEYTLQKEAIGERKSIGNYRFYCQYMVTLEGTENSYYLYLSSTSSKSNPNTLLIEEKIGEKKIGLGSWTVEECNESYRVIKDISLSFTLSTHEQPNDLVKVNAPSNEMLEEELKLKKEQLVRKLLNNRLLLDSLLDKIDLTSLKDLKPLVEELAEITSSSKESILMHAIDEAN